MCKYFTERELRRGWIPNTQDFQEVVSALRAKSVSTPEVIAATIIGSTVEGMADGTLGGNARSDIDVVLVFDKTSHRAVVDVLSGVKRSAHMKNVPLKIHPYPLAEALRATHDCGPGFADHVRESARKGGKLKGNFEDLFWKSDADHFEEAHSYATRKIARLRRLAHEYIVLTPQEKALYFTKLIEAPIHVVRKLLVAASQVTPGQDDKHTVRRAYWEYLRDKALFTELERYVSIDSEYTAFIERSREGFDEDGFQHFERGFEQLIYNVPGFLVANLEKLAQ